MKSIIREYFDYTRSERNGAIGLVIICCSVIVFPYGYEHFLLENKATDKQNFQAEIAEFRARQNTKKTETAGLNQEQILFEFDPNTASEKDLMKLGLQAQTAKTIINYRTKGGRFFKAEDFKKIYSLSSYDYERLLPYIQIKERQARPKKRDIKAKTYASFSFDPNTASIEILEQLLPSRTAKAIVNYRTKGGKFRKKEDLQKIYTLSKNDYKRLEVYIEISLQKAAKHEEQLAFGKATRNNYPDSYGSSIPRIDINQSTAEEWQQLRGIGSGYSRRIIQFRIALGGFTTIEQVSETYDLPDSVFQLIKPLLMPSPILQKLPINKATEEELSKHPYISWKEAKLLIKYRAEHGAYQSITDVKKIRVLKAESIMRFMPYLDFSE